MFCIKGEICKIVQESNPSCEVDNAFYRYCSSKAMPYCEHCYSLLCTDGVSTEKIVKSFILQKDILNKRFKKRKIRNIEPIAAVFFHDEDDMLLNKNHKDKKEVLTYVLIEQYLFLFLLNSIGKVEKDSEKLGTLYVFHNLLSMVYDIKVNYFDMDVVDGVYKKLKNRELGNLSFHELLIAIRIVLISNGDIMGFLVRAYMCRFGFERRSFSRDILTYLGIPFKNIGYSLDEGYADYEAKKDVERLFKEFAIDIPETAGTYYFERKIIGKIENKFGKKYSLAIEKANIFYLSPSLTKNPCLHYALLKTTDEGSWQEAIRLIDEMEVY